MGCELEMKHTIQGALLHLGHLFSLVNYCKIQQLGIHPGQIPMIGIIYKEQGVSQKEIADKLCIKPPTVAVAVKRLENSGIVFRQQDENDARLTHIFLSDKGKSVAEELQKQVEENELILTEGLSKEEKEVLFQLLQKMMNSLEEHINCSKDPSRDEEVLC